MGLSLFRFALVLTGVAICFGCSKNSVELNTGDKKAFEQANPEAKQAWEGALAAEKAKDYLKAQTLLDSLGQMQLNEAQTQALNKEREAFNQQLWKAAEKNDEAAVKAVQAAQRSRTRTTSAPAK